MRLPRGSPHHLNRVAIGFPILEACARRSPGVDLWAMKEPAEHPGVPPRFPYAAMLLCAACVGAAVWTWMHYSYAWDVTPNELHPTKAEFDRIFTKGGWHTWPYALGYVRVHGRFRWAQVPAANPSGVPYLEHIVDVDHPCSTVYARLLSGEDRPDDGAEVVLTCRVVDMDADGRPILDATASRFTWQSIAGLVVGAIGCFVLAVAVRHWLRQRKARAARTASSRLPESPA